MKVQVSKYNVARRKLTAAGVLALALLVLVVSCPLKRMMHGNLSASTAAQKFHRSTVHPSIAADYSATASCCALKKKAQVIQERAVQPGVPSPASLVPYLTVVQGFDIHYFLSGTGNEYPSLTPAASLAVPLFLQHLRLLI